MSDEHRWLDDAEQEAFFSFANVVIRLPGVLDAQLQRDAGISHFEYVVMARLSMTPDHELRMSVLAENVQASLSRLSQVVARLERRGWIARSPDPDDGRYTIATLTEDGMAKVVATAPGHVETVRRYVFDRLSPTQVRQLATISELILETLPPDATWPAEASRPRKGRKPPTG